MSVFYFICMALGFFFAAVGAIFGGHFGHGAHVGGHDLNIGHGHGLDIGHGHAPTVGHGAHVGHGHASHTVGVDSGEPNQMPGASVLNPMTTSIFITFFGASGLIALWVLKLGPLGSLAVSLPTSLIIAAGQFMLFVNVFIKAQASSEATMSEVLGCEAGVTAGIPEGRVGQITYTIKGTRFTAPAMSASGSAISRGTKVQIVNIRGNMLVVRPL